MAHFAELNADNIVTRVVVVSNNEITDSNGDEQESLGIAFLENLYGPSTWKQCSYNGNLRARYPTPGSVYLENIDAFSDVCMYESWALNTETGLHEAPIPEPSHDPETQACHWNESTLQWEIIDIPAEGQTRN